MSEDLRRHIMMQQGGGGSAWLIGYRFSNNSSGAFGVVPDPTHAVLLNVPVDNSFLYSVCTGIQYDDLCQFKCQNIPDVAFDYWRSTGNFRRANQGTSYISICALISEISNVVIGYLPVGHPENAFIVFGEDRELYKGNHIYRYYTTDGGIGINSYCLWNVPRGNTTIVTFLLRNGIIYYNINGGLVDSWTSSYPNPRTVGVGSNVAYFRSNYDINETAHLYIIDTNTGDIIWDNGL